MHVLLQKDPNRKYKNSIYFRYRITIPSKIAREVGLRARERLDISCKNGIITVKKAGPCKGLHPKRNGLYRSNPPHII